MTRAVPQARAAGMLARRAAQAPNEDDATDQVVPVTAPNPISSGQRIADALTFQVSNPMNTSHETPAPRPLHILTPLEARIVGVLAEKQHTVPDTYPLSLNALAAGCNQKTARVPVMNVTEAEISNAIDALKHASLVFEGGGSRVPRFEHNLNRALGIPSQATALLTVMLLRGAQTPAELRLNATRLHGFADVSSVESFLDELAERNPPLVVKLPRAPGERESRWMHLLCGEVDIATQIGAAAASPGDAGHTVGASFADIDALRDDHDRLADEVARLRKLVERMAGELGITIDAPPQTP